jgi:NADP-dependent 3-hydroxy acid dehydrogenase YdfG
LKKRLPNRIYAFIISQKMGKGRGLAIITGASQGIGSAIAIGSAKDGYRVVLIYS